MALASVAPGSHGICRGSWWKSAEFGNVLYLIVSYLCVCVVSVTVILALLLYKESPHKKHSSHLKGSKRWLILETDVNDTCTQGTPNATFQRG